MARIVTFDLDVARMSDAYPGRSARGKAVYGHREHREHRGRREKKIPFLDLFFPSVFSVFSVANSIFQRARRPGYAPLIRATRRG